MPDPLGYDIALPLRARFYPVGFPLLVETNSRHVLEAAGALWSGWLAGTEDAPARLRVITSGARSALPLTPAAPRGQGHLVSIVHGPDNFAVCDLASSFAFACLSADVAEDSEYLRYYFLEPLAYLMTEAAHLAPIHASCVALQGRAVVLSGDSGSGKTSLAYFCARRGWTYLSDDATYVVRGRTETWAAGRPHRIRFRESARRLFPELERFTPGLRPNGKLDIEADTRLLGLNIATGCRPSHIVFLNRDESMRTARLRPSARAEAQHRLDEAVCYGDEKIRTEQRNALARILELPLFDLTYPDPGSAESALRELMTGTALAA